MWRRARRSRSAVRLRAFYVLYRYVMIDVRFSTVRLFVHTGEIYRGFRGIASTVAAPGDDATRDVDGARENAAVVAVRSRGGVDRRRRRDARGRRRGGANANANGNGTTTTTTTTT